MEKARLEGQMEIYSAIKKSSILALRQRVLDKETDPVKEDMNLPYWDRTPTEASAEIAHHCTEFLGKNMAVIQKYVRDGVAPGDDAPTNTGQGVVNGAPGAPPGEEEEVLGGVDLVELSGKCNAGNVKASMAAIVSNPHLATKLRDIKGLRGNRDEQTCAVGLLKELGVISKILWKPPGRVGYCAVYIIKNLRTSDGVAEFLLTDFLKLCLGCSFANFAKVKSSPEESKIKDSMAVPAEPLTVTGITEFFSNWDVWLNGLSRTGRTRVLPPVSSGSASPGEARHCTMSNGAGTPLVSESGRPRPSTAGIAVESATATGASADAWEFARGSDTVRKFIAWICIRSKQAVITNAYLTQKAKSLGYEKEHYEATCAWFRASGLAVAPESRGGEWSKLVLAKPPPEFTDELNNMLTSAFGWTDTEKQSWGGRMGAIGLVNTEFAIEQFKVLVDHLGKPEPG